VLVTTLLLPLLSICCRPWGSLGCFRHPRLSQGKIKTRSLFDFAGRWGNLRLHFWWVSVPLVVRTTKWQSLSEGITMTSIDILSKGYFRCTGQFSTSSERKITSVELWWTYSLLFGGKGLQTKPEQKKCTLLFLFCFCWYYPDKLRRILPHSFL